MTDFFIVVVVYFSAYLPGTEEIMREGGGEDGVKVFTRSCSQSTGA